MQVPWVALVFRPGLEASDAAALVVGVEVQVWADGIVDATYEAHTGVGLLFHDRLLSRHLDPNPFNSGEVLAVKGICGLQSLGHHPGCVEGVDKIDVLVFIPEDGLQQ